MQRHGQNPPVRRGIVGALSVMLRLLSVLRVKRFVRFNAVGALGTFVQLTVLWVLVEAGRVDYLVATIAAVSAAIAHNFVWHRRWTWRDRRTNAATAFTRFTFANGAVSLVGNVVLMALLTGTRGVTPVLANIVAIGVCGLINFWLGDFYVFRRSDQSNDVSEAQSVVRPHRPHVLPRA